MTVDEAKRAADAGGGIVVSNHGGRCLDGTLAREYARYCASRQGRAKVLMDGGIRSGVDVLKRLLSVRMRFWSAGRLSRPVSAAEWRVCGCCLIITVISWRRP